jgi:uncharacterized protein YeaO (DUF488 family)
MIRIKRAYEQAGPDDGVRILVDRIWPRGVTKDAAQIDRWERDLAPSTKLRKEFNHDPEKWDMFVAHYREELEGQGQQLRELASLAKSQTVTLVYGAKDEEHNQAVVLKAILDDTARGS